MESCHNMPSGYQVNNRILQNAATDQVLHSLLKDVSLKKLIKKKNTTRQPSKRKWTGPIDKSGKIHLASSRLRSL